MFWHASVCLSTEGRCTYVPANGKAVPTLAIQGRYPLTGLGTPLTRVGTPCWEVCSFCWNFVGTLIVSFSTKVARSFHIRTFIVESCHSCCIDEQVVRVQVENMNISPPPRFADTARHRDRHRYTDKSAQNPMKICNDLCLKDVVIWPKFSLFHLNVNKLLVHATRITWFYKGKSPYEMNEHLLWTKLTMCTRIQNLDKNDHNP